MIDVAGGSAAVFGYSSGGNLALAAAAAGVPVTHLALYEAPFALGTLPARPADLPARLTELIADGRPGDAVALFQTEGVGIPAAMVEQFRSSPGWASLVAIAQSTVYDATITSVLGVPTPAMCAVDVPTVVITGAQTWPGLPESAAALAALLPHARHVVVPGGADHGIPPEATAAVVRDLLTVRRSPAVRDVHHQAGRRARAVEHEHPERQPRPDAEPDARVALERARGHDLAERAVARDVASARAGRPGLYVGW